ncbi:HNH endonuclease [Actinoplanes sp. NPDC051859]|uniref:HNH endonuclease n=1 Tax=Actinoplanes sp. NPDC051859 TaxID=3363909 RepID=UPI0037B91C98
MATLFGDENDIEEEDFGYVSMSSAGIRPLPGHLQELVDLLPLGVAIHRSQIEAAYRRSNYARRIRKIVSEYGWDIERRRGSNGANDDWYVRRSDGPIRPQQIRYEVPRAVRLKVYERDRWVCALCHGSVDVDRAADKPQCDHKVPAERGGGSDLANLQTLCVRCNLKKRQSCKTCTLTECRGCPLAFPEEHHDFFVVQLSAKAAGMVRDRSNQTGVAPEAFIARVLEELPDR